MVSVVTTLFAGRDGGFTGARTEERQLNNPKRTLAGSKPDCLRQWEENRSLGNGVGPVYWAVNAEQDPAQLVGLRYSGGELFGTPWKLRIYSEEGEQLRSGKVIAQQNYRPYCLVQIKSSSEKLPSDYRDRWILGIAFLPTDDKLKDEEPLVVDTYHSVEKSSQSYVLVELVEWEDKHQLHWGTGALGQIDQSRLDLRWVEPFPNARIELQGDKRLLHVNDS
jgi:hypothetical protein